MVPFKYNYKNENMAHTPHIISNYPLSELNSWKVGGNADFFCEPANKEEIFFILKWAKEKKLPVTYLGQGTNVLISDKGVRGLTIRLAKLKGMESYKSNNHLHIKAKAGTLKAQLMQVFAKHQLAPALFLCGLPGDVAGGVVMNAGVGQNLFPKEFKDIVKAVTVIKTADPLSDLQVLKADITWGYRFSEGWGPGLIYEVHFSWPLEPLPDIPQRLRKMALKRAQSQPLQALSAGSVFKNPEGKKAGALIEQCGLKGHRIGSAQVSDKHGNFILNLGEAKALDIHHLIQFIQHKVREKHHVILEPEVKYIGDLPKDFSLKPLGSA